jgi:hypothetical protein
LNVEKTQYPIQIDPEELLKKEGGQKQGHIDNDQILDHRGRIA